MVGYFIYGFVYLFSKYLINGYLLCVGLLVGEGGKKKVFFI